jgi:hypothetical protein
VPAADADAAVQIDNAIKAKVRSINPPLPSVLKVHLDDPFFVGTSDAEATLHRSQDDSCQRREQYLLR